MFTDRKSSQNTAVDKKSTRKINRLQFIQLPKEKNNKENNKEIQNVE